MNCPHCGADTKNAVTICPLCGKTLDRDDAYRNFMKKGNDFMEFGEIDKAIISYRKAAEYSSGNEEIYLKLGNAYNKKADKQAASMYMKALTYNFYNEHTHNMLIALYSKFDRLDDLKKWYEQSREKADQAFIDKHIKIIQNVHYFRTQADVRIPSVKTDGIAEQLISSMKKYAVMNIVAGIVVFIVALAVVAGVIFRINTSVIIMFSGFFFGVSIIMVFVSRRRKSKKQAVGKSSLAEVMADEIARARGPEEK